MATATLIITCGAYPCSVILADPQSGVQTQMNLAAGGTLTIPSAVAANSPDLAAKVAAGKFAVTTGSLPALSQAAPLTPLDPSQVELSD